jgi:hypothetical protein
MAQEGVDLLELLVLEVQAVDQTNTELRVLEL